MILLSVKRNVCLADVSCELANLLSMPLLHPLLLRDGILPLCAAEMQSVSLYMILLDMIRVNLIVLFCQLAKLSVILASLLLTGDRTRES